MESRLLEIEKHRRRQPLEELERKRKKAARLKGKRTAWESLEASRERKPLPAARHPLTTTVTYRG